MNAKERFMNGLLLKEVDRPPVGAVVTGITVDMMNKVGLHYPEANNKADDIAGLAESVWTVSGIECIKLPFGMTVEVETFGSQMDFGNHDTLPTEIGFLFNDPDELTIPDRFFDMNRVPEVLKAISTLHKKYKDDVAIVTSIVGPFALGAKLFGFDNLFPWILTHPEKVHAVMEKLTPLAIAYSQAQLEAGSDVILIGEATCSGDLISPDTYRDFVVPYHTQICNEIGGPSILHICGRSTGHIPYIAETGVTGYNFDEGVDLSLAQEHLKGKVSLIGYVPTVEVLLQGTPELVYQASLECLGHGMDILAPGCSLPQHTPLENIAAMHRAAQDWANDASLRENPPEVIAALKPVVASSSGRTRRRKRRRDG